MCFNVGVSSDSELRTRLEGAQQELKRVTEERDTARRELAWLKQSRKLAEGALGVSEEFEAELEVTSPPSVWAGALAAGITLIALALVGQLMVVAGFLAILVGMVASRTFPPDRWRRTICRLGAHSLVVVSRSRSPDRLFEETQVECLLYAHIAEVSEFRGELTVKSVSGQRVVLRGLESPESLAQWLRWRATAPSQAVAPVSMLAGERAEAHSAREKTS